MYFDIKDSVLYLLSNHYGLQFHNCMLNQLQPSILEKLSNETRLKTTLVNNLSIQIESQINPHFIDFNNFN